MRRNQGLFESRRARRERRVGSGGWLRRLFGKVKAKLAGRSSIAPKYSATDSRHYRDRIFVNKATRRPAHMRKALSRRRNKIAKASRRRNRK